MNIVRNILPAVLAWTLSSAPASASPHEAVADDETEYGYDGVSTTWGTGKAETYDIALHITEKALVGSTVRGVLLPVTVTNGITDQKIWMSRQLTLENKTNVPDITSQDVSATEEGWMEVRFDEPYTITEDGVYVGYSLTVSELDKYNKSPIVINSGQYPGGLYLHTSRTYLKWMDKTESMKATTGLKVILSGMPPAAASVSGMEKISIGAGTPVKGEFTLTNHGASAINDIDYTYSIGGQTGTVHAELGANALPAQMNTSTKVAYNLPVSLEAGTTTLTIRVDKLNGKENTDAENEMSVPVDVFGSMPKRRALVEEYTGGWCGWCPRGQVALEMMDEKYGDDFIGIAYHSGDAMQIAQSEDYPSNPDGWPSAFIDRAISCDPYYGVSGKTPLGIESTWIAMCGTFSPAAIGGTAALTDNGSSVDVTAEVVFPLGMSGGGYRLAYVLVADGLHGEGSIWEQKNYYSGEKQSDTNLEPLTRQPEDITGMLFNDVAIAMSPVNGVDGSMPESAGAEETVRHTYKFRLADAVNILGQPLVQDKSRLEAVAILIDTASGAVVNSVKMRVSDPTGIDGTHTDGLQPTYYDLSGHRVDKPQKGVSIVRYGDGRARKVIIR